MNVSDICYRFDLSSIIVEKLAVIINLQLNVTFIKKIILKHVYKTTCRSALLQFERLLCGRKVIGYCCIHRQLVD